MLQYSGAAITKLAEKWHGLGVLCFFFLFSISWKCVKILTFECHTLHSACEIKDISLKETYAPCSLFWFSVQLVTMHLHFVHTFGFATRAVLLRKGCKLFSTTSLGTSPTAAPAPGSQWPSGWPSGWPSVGERLFPASFCLVPFQDQPIEATCPTSVDSGSVATAAFPPTVLPPISFSLWEMPEIALSLPRSALGKHWQSWKPCI